MEWLIPLVVFSPLAGFALYRPHTPQWRRARRAFWVSLPVMIGAFVFVLLAVDPAGPAVVYYGAWGVVIVIMTVYCLALGTIRAELRKYRAARAASQNHQEDHAP